MYLTRYDAPEPGRWCLLQLPRDSLSNPMVITGTGKIEMFTWGHEEGTKGRKILQLGWSRKKNRSWSLLQLLDTIAPLTKLICCSFSLSSMRKKLPSKKRQILWASELPLRGKKWLPLARKTAHSPDPAAMTATQPQCNATLRTSWEPPATKLRILTSKLHQMEPNLIMPPLITSGKKQTEGIPYFFWLQTSTVSWLLAASSQRCKNFWLFVHSCWAAFTWVWVTDCLSACTCTFDCNSGRAATFKK